MSLPSGSSPQSDPGQLHIGFYVHYHGLGHKHRTEAILRHLNTRATVVTSRAESLKWSSGFQQSGDVSYEVLDIACDIDAVPDCGRTHADDVPALHYAPLWTDNITRRVAQFTHWLDRCKPDLMVVDVSAEISMLTRLASIPQVVMRQHGDRSDVAHETAYAAAHSLLAPFPQTMEDDITPAWVRDKTIYLSGFCRLSPAEVEPVHYTRPTIVVMFGRGGSEGHPEQLCEAARQASDFDWIVVGKPTPDGINLPSNLRYVGWTSTPWQYTANCEIVVTAAGHNSVMELGYQRCRFIAIAQPRPFDEQIRKAHVLDREGLAVGLDGWPEAHQWPEILRRAGELDIARWDQVYAGDGSRQAADHLTAVANWSRRQRCGSWRPNLDQVDAATEPT